MENSRACKYRQDSQWQSSGATWKSLVILAALAALTASCAAQKDGQGPQPASMLLPGASDAIAPGAGCANGFGQGGGCEAANKRALEIMGGRKLEAFTVVQDVGSGALIVFAASQPSTLDVTTSVLPLSFAKVFLVASWWDNKQPNARFDSSNGKANATNPAYRTRVSVHDTLVGGSDSAGRQMAIALRRSVGARTVVMDLKRYGLEQSPDSPAENQFWIDLAPKWETRLKPAVAYASLDEKMTDTEWGDTLSIGEINMKVTGLHISRFLQAAGNDGIGFLPAAREEQVGSTRQVNGQITPLPIRVMQKATALRLQSAMRDTVKRGTAQEISGILADTGWQIGGKTGTGPGPAPIGPQSDGWFAGLVFDPKGKPRFTVATFVRHGGRGGGHAARISAELARYLIQGK